MIGFVFQLLHVLMAVSGPVTADSAHMLLRLAINGAGTIRFGDIIVAEAIQTADLCRCSKTSSSPKVFHFGRCSCPAGRA